MNFSDFFKLSNHLCKISNDGTKFANAVLDKVVIRDVENMELVKVLKFKENVQHLEWSPDSTMILCANFKKSLIRIWLLDNPNWKCEIDEGTSGLVNVQWSPDSQHILSTADFHLQITVWSLVTKTISYIQRPKNCSKYMDFTRSGKYLAVAERKGCEDRISVFDCLTWCAVNHFRPSTDDLDGVCWSPTRDVLCVWESCFVYKVLLYSPNGQCLTTFCPNDAVLGVRSVTWSPSGQILVIGSFDEKLRLLNHLTWGLVEEFQHDEMSVGDIPIYKEIVEPDDCKSPNQYAMMSPQNLLLPIVKPETSKVGCHRGMGTIIFSCDSGYVASIHDAMPSCVWIWNVMTLKCSALIIQDQSIKDMSWDPMRSRLAVCTGSSTVLIWTPDNVISVPVPFKDGENFSVLRMKWWSLGGSRLALIGHEQMCWCSTLPEHCQITN